MRHGWRKLLSCIVTFIVLMIVGGRSSRVIIHKVLLRPYLKDGLVAWAYGLNYGFNEVEVMLVLNHLHSFWPNASLVQVLSAIVRANSSFFMGVRAWLRLLPFLLGMVLLLQLLLLTALVYRRLTQLRHHAIGAGNGIARAALTSGHLVRA